MEKPYRAFRNVESFETGFFDAKRSQGIDNSLKDCYETLEKLVRSAEHPKSDNFKKLSILDQMLIFL